MAYFVEICAGKARVGLLPGLLSSGNLEARWFTGSKNVSGNSVHRKVSARPPGACNVGI
jgi:hypothetical protein